MNEIRLTGKVDRTPTCDNCGELSPHRTEVEFTTHGKVGGVKKMYFYYEWLCDECLRQANNHRLAHLKETA